MALHDILETKGVIDEQSKFSKTYVIEITRVISFLVARGQGKKGKLKMRREFRKSLKTHIEKMSAFRLSMIFMKTNELNRSLHDVDEKIGSYLNQREKWRVTRKGETHADYGIIGKKADQIAALPAV